MLCDYILANGMRLEAMSVACKGFPGRIFEHGPERGHPRSHELKILQDKNGLEYFLLDGSYLLTGPQLLRFYVRKNRNKLLL